MPTTLRQIRQAADRMREQVPNFTVGFSDAGPRWIPSDLQVIIPTDGGEGTVDDYHSIEGYDFADYQWDLVWLEFIGLHRSPAYRAEMLRQAAEWERQAQADMLGCGMRVPPHQNPLLEELECDNGWFQIDALNGQNLWKHWDIFHIDANGDLTSLPFHRRYDPMSYHDASTDWARLENHRIDLWARQWNPHYPNFS